jgi:hypothetical protein
LARPGSDAGRAFFICICVEAMKNKTRRPAVQYPPGYFLSLVRKHDWPPRFEPAPWVSARLSNGLTQSEQSTLCVELGRAAGRGYASGTIPLTGTPKMHKPLGWM